MWRSLASTPPGQMVEIADEAPHSAGPAVPPAPPLAEMAPVPCYRTAHCVPRQRESLPGSMVRGEALVSDVVIGLTCDEDGGWD